MLARFSGLGGPAGQVPGLGRSKPPACRRKDPFLGFLKRALSFDTVVWGELPYSLMRTLWRSSDSLRFARTRPSAVCPYSVFDEGAVAAKNEDLGVAMPVRYGVRRSRTRAPGAKDGRSDARPSMLPPLLSLRRTDKVRYLWTTICYINRGSPHPTNSRL
jgi:hypothetical protein